MRKKNSNKNVIKGRWYNINKKIQKRLLAKYHKIKDWKMDPKGYFLIAFVFYKISNKINFKNLFIYSFFGSFVFFIISNFGVWALGSPGVYDIAYDKNFNGLLQCYILAIPFFGNTFLSTLIFAYPAIFIYKSLTVRSSSR